MSLDTVNESLIESSSSRPTSSKAEYGRLTRYEYSQHLKPLLAARYPSLPIRWHPSAVIYLYDTFGGYEKATFDFCDYLTKRNDLPEVIDIAQINKALEAVKDETPFDPIVRNLGGNLADLVIGEDHNELLRPSIRWMLKQAKLNRKYPSTRDDLRHPTSQPEKLDEVWRHMQQHPLFIVDGSDNGEYCRLRIKWWKFSTWWEHPDEAG